MLRLSFVFKGFVLWVSFSLFLSPYLSLYWAFIYSLYFSLLLSISRVLCFKFSISLTPRFSLYYGVSSLFISLSLTSFLLYLISLSLSLSLSSFEPLLCVSLVSHQKTSFEPFTQYLDWQIFFTATFVRTPAKDVKRSPTKQLWKHRIRIQQNVNDKFKA